MTDPLLTALLDKLPEPGRAFTTAERTNWIAALEACIDIVYANKRHAQPTDQSQQLVSPQTAGKRQGHIPAKQPCETCGVPISPQGRHAHMAMHIPAKQPCETCGVPISPQGRHAHMAMHAKQPPQSTKDRRTFDPDAARLRAAASI